MIIILKRGEVQGSEVHDDVINDYFIYAHIRVKLYHDTLDNVGFGDYHWYLTCVYVTKSIRLIYHQSQMVMTTKDHKSHVKNHKFTT